ncbi:hypothetical protein R3W88_011403 [Solanum pinnatisectum]|uniref:Reverse transcriptase zinc-binding domain-containing protein n=1 Tax=Solanum pinnatisectum TaxID=50273 RepID=A0AAV9L8I3_9SOLN|nr:hypothetical protein R3W88_011403 [Solanum pinnatisectum]
MRVPTQACWIIRKTIEARTTFDQFQVDESNRRSLTRQLYMHLMNPEPRVIWRNLMYKNAARPRARFILWLQVQNKLLTTDRLIKWGKSVSPICPLCTLHNKSRDHIFTSCVYGVEIWRIVQQWIQAKPIQSLLWDQHLTEVLRCVKGKTQAAQVSKIVYTEFVHCLWIERNMRIFEKKSRESNVSAKEIAFVCSVRAPPRIIALMSTFRFSCD